jgi:hypothetical protein
MLPEEAAKAKKQPLDYSEFAKTGGKDIHGHLYFSYNPRLHEFYCEFCREHYPFGFLIFIFFIKKLMFDSDPVGKPFVGEPSKTHQKNDLQKHLLSQVHGWSAHNEGVKSGRELEKSSMDRFKKPILNDVEAIAGYIRLSYTMFRQEVPFSKHLFIHRAYVSWTGNDFLMRVGHFSHDCIRQTLRLTSNYLWGFVDSFLAFLRYIGIEIDDGSDCTQ